MNKYLIIGRPTAWAIAIINLGFAVYQILNVLLKWGQDLSMLSNVYWIILTIGIVLFINDILYSKVYQKWFWVLSIIILAPITPIYYLFQRDKLIRLGEKFKEK